MGQKKTIKELISWMTVQMMITWMSFMTQTLRISGGNNKRNKLKRLWILKGQAKKDGRRELKLH